MTPGFKSVYKPWWCVCMFLNGFLPRKEGFPPNIRNTAHRCTTDPPSRHENVLQSSQEEDNPECHTWCAVYTQTQTSNQVLTSILPKFWVLKKSDVIHSMDCYRSDGAWTDQPKSAILSSPLKPSSRFSGLISRWITFFSWQYWRASAISSINYTNTHTQFKTALYAALNVKRKMWNLTVAVRWSLKRPQRWSSLYISPRGAYSRTRNTRDESWK